MMNPQKRMKNNMSSFDKMFDQFDKMFDGFGEMFDHFDEEMRKVPEDKTEEVDGPLDTPFPFLYRRTAYTIPQQPKQEGPPPRPASEPPVPTKPKVKIRLTDEDKKNIAYRYIVSQLTDPVFHPAIKEDDRMTVFHKGTGYTVPIMAVLKALGFYGEEDE